MPELPEVETVLRTLENQIKGLEIKYVIVHWQRIVNCKSDAFIEELTHEKFCGFKRRGKYLIFEMQKCALISHLRMEGKYFYVDQNDPMNKHVHVVFGLSNGMELRYHDTRKFGRMEIVPLPLDCKQFKNLGPEPWDDEFNAKYCKEFLRNKKGPIKKILLDQSFVAGIGNIYADEICFKMGVDPRRPCCKITMKNCSDLVQYTRDTLQEAIACGGTTIRSYTSSLGITGRFQLQVCVHGKEGEECPLCKTKIQKIKVVTRGTYYCSTCQKR